MKSSARTDKLIPASWFMLLMVLMFVLLVNSVLAVFVSPDFLNLFRGLAALLVSVQMSVLAYNVIRRNYLLFIKDGKTEWVEAMPETKLERKKTVRKKEKKLLGELTKKRFEALVLKDKLYLNPRLTISDVAERLDTNRTYLSAFVNLTYEKRYRCL